MLHPAVRSIAERNALAEQWQYIVPYVMRRLIHLSAVRRYESECWSAGYLALLRAAALWRPDGRANFRTYAIKCIQKQIYREAYETHDHLTQYPYEDYDAAAPDQPDPLEDADLRAGVAGALGQIRERWARVIRLRYGLGCDPHSVAEAAAALGVSGNRIRQVEARALARLRQHLAAPAQS